MADYIKKKSVFINSRQNTMGQFVRYTMVGGLASIVDIFIFNVGIHYLHINHILSNTLSFTAGLLINYYLSRGWVFNQKVFNFKKDFILFSFIGLIGLLLSNLILFVLIDLGLLIYLLAPLSTDIIKFTAKIAAVFLVLFWNFIARKKLVFQQ